NEFFIYDYLEYRQFLHQLLLPAVYFQLFAMIFVITVFPIVFKISFVFPLNQLIKDIEFEFLRGKKNRNNHIEEDKFELSQLKNAFFRIGDMIRNAKKELEEVSKPLDVLEFYINEDPKEIKIGNHTLIYKSNSFDKTIHEVYQASRYPHPVTITGETGCGKELVAKLIHQSSEYKEGPFLAINCATLPESLWEAEIFGAKKGSYTDSKADRKGRIEEASGGSIFFDEIGEMPISIQAKMLRLLQEKKFVPIGANVEQNVQCRFIFATNQNLDELVKKKLFREDLLYRIKVFHIHLIPLRERLEDIPYLLNFFINRFRTQFNRIEPKFSDDAMSKILNYSWPGNIRELENFVTRIMSQTSKDVIEPTDMIPFLSNSGSQSVQQSGKTILISKLGLEEEIKELSRNLICTALREENGNVTKAAERLQMKRTTLLYKMKELGIAEKKSIF
ncbi:sigma-54-dependent Fis family transcriptional regulator, partial [Leptospira yanagawae]